MSEQSQSLLAILGALPLSYLAYRLIRHFEEQTLERWKIRRLTSAGLAAARVIDRAESALTEALGASPLADPRVLRSHLVLWRVAYRPWLARRLGLTFAGIALTYAGISALARKAGPPLWKKLTEGASVPFADPAPLILPAIIVSLRICLIGLFVHLCVRSFQFMGQHPAPYNPNYESSTRRPGPYAPVAQLIYHTTCAAESLALLQSGIRTRPQVFSVDAAQRVVRSAHSVNYSRHVHRRKLREHGEKVAGALREAEYHQHVDPSQGLTDIIHMLAKITERYAQGRLGALLDENDKWMRDVSPARGHYLWKLLVAGLTITGLSAGALLLGLPEGAAGPLIGTLAPLAGILMFRSQMPGGNALMDMFRSAERSAP
ncbi:hypothetical protein GTW29_12275 [Streptomyces sp. SID7834]|nr:hypothetical protein [Streptomyces sp. SID7834]MYT57475.1 hypothetical protein [Streptomyces sp. SID7834]